MKTIIPKSPIRIRTATMADIPFIDSLQGVHSKMVRWMPGKQLEGKIKLWQVLGASASRPVTSETTWARRPCHATSH